VTDEPIEQEGIARAKATAVKADLVLRVSEPGSSIAQDASWPNTIHVLNKADLIGNTPIPQDAIATIATTGQGIANLQTQIIDHLAHPNIAPGSPAVLNERQRSLVLSLCGEAVKS
jgi:tRNA modification GTPase